MCEINCSGGCASCAPDDHLQDVEQMLTILQNFTFVDKKTLTPNKELEKEILFTLNNYKRILQGKL